MRLDYDCVRAILLEMEQMPFQGYLSLKDLTERLSDFSSDTIEYCCLKLKEGNYIKVLSKKEDGKDRVKRVTDICFDGHELLNNIRDSKAWKKIKDVLKTAGSVSLKVLVDVAPTIIKGIITSQIG